MGASRARRRRRVAAAAALVFVWVVSVSSAGAAPGGNGRGHGGGSGGGGGTGGSIAFTTGTASVDTSTNGTSQHATEVEPDTFAWGSTVLAAFQVGRFTDGGSSAIGWARSSDSGTTWTNGYLPHLTVNTPGVNMQGTWARATDPSVAYDAAHGAWLIATLPLTSTVTGAAVTVSRSTNGGASWNDPINVATASGSQDFDKSWIACDNTSTSPYYGHCYVTWDDFGNGNLLLNSTSTDGGLTWGAALPTGTGNAHAAGLGGQPVVQPNGTVIVAVDNAFETSLGAYLSIDGGASWTAPQTITTIKSHTEAANLRSGPLPSAEIDGAGRVFVVWADCRFRSRCNANDLVFSTSTDGVSWTAVTRVPIDSTGSGVDHFLPGVAVDPATAGTTTAVAISYYFYPSSNCSSASCQLNVGMVGSLDGGSTWTAPALLNPSAPMSVSWLPSTTQGPMVGDYTSTSWVSGKAATVLPVAVAPSGATLNQPSRWFVATVSSASPSTVATRADPILTAPSESHGTPTAQASRR